MTGDVQTEVSAIDSEVECRNWLEAVFWQSSHHMVMERVREVNAVISTFSPAELVQWTVAEKMKLTALDSPYRLNTAAMVRVEKLIGRGRAVPFGAEMAKRSIDRDHVLISWLSAQARPTTREEI